MTSVGVRELKTNLSAYLRKVRRGEAVQVTDRGEVIADIVPPDVARELGLTPEGLAMVRAGTLRLAERKLTRREMRELFKPVVRVPPGTVQRIIDDLRGED